MIDRLFISHPWFHSIDFGNGRVSPGRFAAARPQNYTLFGTLRYLEHTPLSGMECLDIGTMDGLAAFSMKQAGAARVVASDMAPRETFLAGRDALGLEIDYYPDQSLYTMPETLGRNRFDMVVCAGILYHLMEPLSGLYACRNLIRDNGLLVLETQYLRRESGARIAFEPAGSGRGTYHPNTFFRPGMRALRAMLEIAGFEVLSSIAVNSRITVLARAVRPSAMHSTNPRVTKVLQEFRTYANYREVIDHAALEAPQARSAIACALPHGRDYWIGSSRFSTRNPLQPPLAASKMQRFTRQRTEALARMQTMLARRRWLTDLSATNPL